MHYDDDMGTTPLVFDIETTGRPDARDFIDPPAIPDAPDLGAITAPANYKDEAKIAAYIEEAKAKALANHESSRLTRLAEYEEACTNGAALDPNVGRIVAIGWHTEERGTVVRTCGDELQERIALSEFWHEKKGRTMVGFCCKQFDMRFLVRRSQLLKVDYPWLDFGKYSRKGVIDLYLDLTFGDGHHDRGVMKRSLKSFARLFGIDTPDDINGSEIPALVAGGNWAAVEAHCRADVALTVALARKLSVIRQEEPALF